MVPANFYPYGSAAWRSLAPYTNRRPEAEKPKAEKPKAEKPKAKK